MIVRTRAALLALALLAAGAARAQPAGPVLDEQRIARARFGNDAPWYAGNIPFFESSDPLLDQVYYYRWQIVRAHQRDLGPRGYITTEFLDDVGWQREPYASLNDATAFHILEERWLRDRRYADDYIDYLYAGGGNDRHFSEAIPDAVYQRFLADGDAAFATKHLDAMEHVYNLWDDHYDFARRLYWIEPLLDATEYTIASIDASGGVDGFTGGHAFRPSINSYMFANARAIGRLAALTGDTAAASLYAAKADDLRTQAEKSLWSAPLGHFVDRYRVQNAHVRYWEPIRGRELVGYVPWAFGLPSDDPERAAAWRHLLSPAELGGPAGMRTVEPSYQYYMRQYRYDKATGRRECQWNGPAWPFQTTQVLAGMANLLHDYRQDVVERGDYLRLLRQYAALHLQDGQPDLEEDYDPATGKPIVGLARSHHYFHSGFIDLIVTGLVGLRPRADGVLEVDPLVPATGAGALRYFTLQGLPYHGHRIGITYDADGRRYGRGAGLSLAIDGVEVARAPRLGRLGAPIAQGVVPPISRPIDLAANLVRTDFPRASASTNNDPAVLHQAIDGRVWFFPELPNGWQTTGSQRRREWFAVDFGAPRAIGSAELSFFADGQAITAPRGYVLEAWRDGRWSRLYAASGVVANGTSEAAWVPVTASRVRLVLALPPGKAIRLVEMKIF